MELDPFYLKHVKYFYALIKKKLPEYATTYDPIRTTILQFSLLGLGVLDAGSLLSQEEKTNIANWIKSCYINGSGTESESELIKIPCGFRGNTDIGCKFSSEMVFMNNLLFYKITINRKEFHILIVTIHQYLQHTLA